VSPQIAQKLKDIGLDPIVPLPICAEVLGMSTQTVKNIARRGLTHPAGGLEILRVSERRCGIRRSVLDAFLDRKSAAVTGKKAGPRLGIIGKPEVADGALWSIVLPRPDAGWNIHGQSSTTLTRMTRARIFRTGRFGHRPLTIFRPTFQVSRAAS
jgi:hypothetical protein